MKKDKCVIGVKSIEFLGFLITDEGIKLLPNKAAAIRDAPPPNNKKELQAFLGILNFYHQFLRDKASIAEPLHRLLDKNRKWTWTRDHQRSFERLKGLISADNVLIHYDLNLPLGLVCDASPYGVGAVLFHTTEDDVERPIAFYSRTLSKTE